jgi:succinylglutamate desuccinylase
MLPSPHDNIWRFAGTRGQRIAIVGGMHGDETGNIRLLQELAQLEHPYWKTCPHEVTLVLGHPNAIQLGTRKGADGGDLNRAFGSGPRAASATEDRARLLKKVLSGVDLVLDLHQTHRPIAPCAVCPASPEHLALAGQLGAVQAVTGTQALYGDRMLTDWVNAQGHLGLTLEAGQIGDALSYQTAKEAVRRLLLPEAMRPKPTSLKRWKVIGTLPAPGSNYTFAKNWFNGSPVTKGQLIATSTEGDLFATTDGAIFLPWLGQRPGTPCCVQVASF